MTFSTDIQMFDVPTSSTNGQILKMVFKELTIRTMTESLYGVTFYDNQDEITWMPAEWWNAPYFTKERGYER